MEPDPLIATIDRLAKARMELIAVNIQAIDFCRADDGGKNTSCELSAFNELREMFALDDVIDDDLSLDDKYQAIEEILISSKKVYHELSKLCGLYRRFSEKNSLEIDLVKSVLVDRIRHLMHLFVLFADSQENLIVENQDAATQDLSAPHASKNIKGLAGIFEANTLKELLGLINTISKGEQQLEVEKLFNVIDKSPYLDSKIPDVYFQIGIVIKNNIVPLIKKIGDEIISNQFYDDIIKLNQRLANDMLVFAEEINNADYDSVTILTICARYHYLAATASLQVQDLQIKMQQQINTEIAKNKADELYRAVTLAFSAQALEQQSKIKVNVANAGKLPEVPKQNTLTKTRQKKSQQKLPQSNMQPVTAVPAPIFQQQKDEILALQKLSEIAAAREIAIQKQIDADNKKAAEHKKINKALKSQQYAMQAATGPQSSQADRLKNLTQPVQPNVITELSATNLNLLHQIFDATPANINLTFTYENIANLAKNCGADVINGDGALRIFRFRNFDMLTYDISARTNFRVHEPHGQRGDLLLGCYVKQFRDALTRAGITKETVRKSAVNTAKNRL